MVRAWYMDDSDDDQRAEHHKDPPEVVPLNELVRKTRVEYFRLDPETLDTDDALERLKIERGYTFEDEIVCSKDRLPNYEEKLKSFYAEHLHSDEEIRLVVEGSGYFDVRDDDDRWIRIEVVPGDGLVLPSGIYHRFTLDKKDFIRARRFFKGEPVWVAHDRPADGMECRKGYLRSIGRPVDAR